MAEAIRGPCTYKQVFGHLLVIPDDAIGLSLLLHWLKASIGHCAMIYALSGFVVYTVNLPKL